MKNKIIVLGSIISICLIILIIFSILISNSGGAPLNIDIWARDLFYKIRGEEKNFFYYLLRGFTEFGYLYFAIILGVFILIITKGDYRFFTYVLGAVLMVLMNQCLKDIFQRERPIESMRWVYEKSSSFPSGHATTVGFWASYMIYFFFDSNYKKVYKNIGYGISIFALIIVPITRIYFGVHYISDTTAGLALGAIVGSLMIILNMISKKYGIFETPFITTIYHYFKDRKKNHEITETNNEENESIDKNEDIK